MPFSLRPFAFAALFGAVGFGAAVPAYAQTSAQAAAGASDPALTQYATCNGKPTQPDTDAAHGAYMAGKGSFDEADYATAINYFKDAYRRDCTKNELLIIIARAFELQGNRREAVHALETYLERVPTAQDAEVQRRHIANLKREIDEQAAAAAASASATPAATPPPPAAAPPVVSPPPPPPASPPPSEPSPHHTAGPWIVVAVGGAALITGGVLLGVGASQVSSAEGVCGSSHLCPAGDAGSSAISKGNSGRTEESVGVAVGAVGLAAIAGGLIWHFVEHPAPSDQKAARAEITPVIGLGYAGVGGKF